MAEVLIDTNVLVYAHDPGEPTKHARAVQTLELLLTLGVGCVSTQVLLEFVSATTKGRRPLLPLADALRQAELIADSFLVLEVTKLVTLEGLRGVRQHSLGLFDAQVWATAKLNQVPTVFTEDFTDGRRLEGVRFVNPLKAGFDLRRSV
jgi:predicted nucleic acid-binding protein